MWINSKEGNNRLILSLINKQDIIENIKEKDIPRDDVYNLNKIKSRKENNPPPLTSTIVNCDRLHIQNQM